MADRKSLEVCIKRMYQQLEEMDALAATEDEKEICAETEDSLFFIESADPDDEDDMEEIVETLAQLRDSLVELSEGDFAAKASELGNTTDIALRNLEIQ